MKWTYDEDDTFHRIYPVNVPEDRRGQYVLVRRRWAGDEAAEGLAKTILKLLNKEGAGKSMQEVLDMVPDIPPSRPEDDMNYNYQAPQ